MAFIGLLTLTVLLTVCVLTAANHPLVCVHCHGDTDPAVCTAIVLCQEHESCYTDVRYQHEEYRFYKGCRITSECDGYSMHGLICTKCCDRRRCNLHNCGHHALLSSKAPTNTTTASAHSQRKTCNICHGNIRPERCTEMVECHADEDCFTEVRHYGGWNHFFKGCRKASECRIEPDNQLHIRCMDCCDHSDCNRNTCEHISHTTKAPTATSSTSSSSATVTTTSASTTPPSITGSNLCRNHEEDGVTCSSMAHYKFCSVQDPTTFSYEIAHNKCAKYCGFCDTTTTTRAQTTQDSTCTDHELGGFKCADYDQYNVCTDVSGVGRSIALNQCPKHCGLCGSQHATGAPVTLTSFNPLSTTTGNSQAQLTTGKQCVDREDSVFSCASWANNGFCQTTSGMLHDITVFRCSKFCGIC